MNVIDKMFAGCEKSLDQFDAYRRDYADVERCRDMMPVRQLLLPWANHKAGLYQMFGEKLILTKDVVYERDHEELREDMERMLSNHSMFIQHFFARLAEELGVNVSMWREYAYHDDTPLEQFFYMCRSAMNENNLVEARLVDDMPEVVLCGERVRLARGQKTMRAIGKIARILGLTQEFESFRVAHSMVLNQAKLKGRLHLSIHPLDYATASDNESGWSSCMSWREGGAYRLGTVEMMTSPYVICAYLASDSVEMNINDNTWPSKKWRAWVIVTDEFIVVNRNYPYDNEDLMRACVDWVKELASEYYHVTYGETHDHWNQGEFFDIDMNFMYNDLGDGHVGCYAEGADSDYCENINISGPAICMWCGDLIEWNSDDDAACTLTCQECSGRVRCTCCGASLDREYVNWGPDDEPYCECCFGERFTYCEHCDNTVDSDECHHVVIPVDKEYMKQWIQTHETELGLRHTYISNTLDITICDDCLRRNGISIDDLDWDAQVPFENITVWGASRHWDGEMINPKANTWEKIAEMFGYDAEDEYYAAIWNHYAETVRSHRWHKDLFI